MREKGQKLIWNVETVEAEKGWIINPKNQPMSEALYIQAETSTQVDLGRWGDQENLKINFIKFHLEKIRRRFKIPSNIEVLDENS